MAPRTQQQNLASDERTEREFALDVNTAVANTEGEIAAFAFGEDEPENDADTSLEQMGDGLEGGDLEDEVDDTETGDEEIEAAEGDETDEVEEPDEVDDRQPQRQQDDRRLQRTERQDDDRQERRGVPPGVHRDRVRTERQRAETAEQRGDRLERELAETRGQVQVLTQLSQQPRRAEQQREQPDPKPDMFVDPDGYQAWQDRQVERRAREIAQQTVGSFRQEMQQRDETRINTAFEEAASGPRGFEFNAAYRTLTTTLDPRNARDRATVSRIVNAQDPTQALFDWFEDNGAEDFRATVAEQLGLEPQGYENDRGQQRQERRNGGDNRQQRQNGGNRQQPRQQQGQPRQVYRMPPSLNAARGGSGNRQGQQANPDMQDDSDASSFEFAMR